jgi:glutamine synthetase
MAFFKYMVKAIAEKHELRATFMPKPFMNLTGSGCHVHVSMWKDGKNVFDDGNDGLGLSRDAYKFIGGVMDAASEICAITNPTINSYKRINAPVTLSGATWSPNTVTYAGNNRTHMIRVPGGGRFEFRLADGATNPYLLPSALLAAGLDGIARGVDPGKPLDIDMYTEGHKAPAGTKKLPLNLLDALRLTEKSALLRRELGDEFVDSYVKLKNREWNDYSRHLTEWERAATLDC